MNKTIIAIVIALVLVAGGVLIAMQKSSTSNISFGNKVLIVSTFPGVSDDIKLITNGCSKIEVKSLAPPGVDPHEYSLRPSDVKVIERASLVISTGHAPFESAVAKYVSKDKLVVIPDIPGIGLLRLPSGSVNRHMPIYDPSNYIVFIKYVGNRLEGIVPSCNETINNNINYIINNTYKLEKYTNILKGVNAVASSPAVQYPSHWLGLNITVYLTLGYNTQSTPESVLKAKQTLEHGGIAVILVDENGNPLSTQDKNLANLASQLNAPILKIPAPFNPGTTIKKLSTIATEAESIKTHNNG